MKYLFASDIHGDWARFYERAWAYSPDVVFLAGDVETTRDELDMEATPGPAKFRWMGNFQEFWKRGSVPLPTYFILGNHEPFPWYDELEQNHTGFIKIIDNLFYLGRTGCAEIHGLKMAWFGRVYGQETFAGRKRYNPKDKRSLRSKLAAHFLPEDVEYLKTIASGKQIEVLMVHENPHRVTDPKHKQIYVDMVESIQPQYIVCGHIHERQSLEFAGSQLECVTDKEFFVIER